jgi:hypothetical protein
VEWDTTIALAYAAEQLFIAAQALTSDLVSTDHGLSIADTRLTALLENAEFLPNSVTRQVRDLHECYFRRRTAAHRDASVARSLATDTMAALEKIRGELSGMRRDKLAA